MKNIKSWRWSRLNDLNALKRTFSLTTTLYVLMLIGLNVIPIFPYAVTLALSLLCVYNILAPICLADAYIEFFSKEDESKTKIYVYQNNILGNKYELHIKYQDIEEVTLIDNYRFISSNDKDCWFLFSIKETALSTPIWHCYKDNTTIRLGKLIGNIIFLENKNDKGEYCVNILNSSNQIIRNKANKVFLHQKELLIPAYKGMYEFDETDFVLIKQDNKYRLLSGTYTVSSKSTSPFFEEVHLTPLVIKDEDKTVVLTWNDRSQSYHECYRGKNLLGLSDTIVETNSSTFPCNASIYRVDKKNNFLKNIYHGEILWINFDKKFIRCSTEKIINF